MFCLEQNANLNTAISFRNFIIKLMLFSLDHLFFNSCFLYFKKITEPIVTTRVEQGVNRNSFIVKVAIT